MLVVSCCGEDGGIFTIDSDKVEKVFPYGCSGITRIDDGYIGFSHALQSLLRFNSKFVLKQSQVVGNDFHGVVYYNNELYAVDTYHDRIYKYNLSTLSGIFAWDFAKELACPMCGKSMEDRNDFFHINDLYMFQNWMLMSMFCDRPTANDERNTSGIGKVYVKDLNDQENTFGTYLIVGLIQPHTPFIYGKEFYVCNSKAASIIRGVLKTENGVVALKELREIQIGKGFTRGLWVNDKRIYIGISSSEKRTVDEFKEVQCGVVVLDKKTLKQVSFIPLPASEVYGILEV
jgi:hypothetical protein